MMAVWSNISTSALVGALRLDAEFWQPKYLDKEKAICAGEHMSLGALVSTFRKGIFYILAKEYADHGISFYRSSNVGDILPIEENLAFITNDKNTAEAKTSLTVGDLMIVKTGKSGASVVFDESCNVSQDVIAVKAKREKVDPFYLAVFLNTKYGKSEMDRWFQGQVQPHLSLDDARKIWVSMLPEPEQAAVAQLVVLSWKSRNAAKASYAEAQQLLESELGLDKLHFDKLVGYTTQFSELGSAHRADADYYNPELRFLWKMLAERWELVLMPAFAKIEKFSNPDYGSEGLPIVTQKHLRNIAPDDYGDDLRTTQAWRDANPSAVLHKNDLLFYSVGAYLGKTNVWLNDDDAVPASFITLLRCHDAADACYLYLLLNSRYGILQSKCFQSGTSQQYIYPKDIRRFLVPNLPPTFRKKVGNLITKSFVKQNEAHELLHEAKARVEHLIKEAIEK